MRGRLLLVLAAVVGAAFAPAPKPKARRAAAVDLEAISGRWLLVGLQNDVTGQEVRKPTYRLEVEIKDGKYTYHRSNGNGGAEQTMTTVIGLDPAKSPCWFDLKRPTGAVSSVGVCALEGDTLRLCFTSGKERPKAAKPTAKGERMLVLKRIKPG
jgi:uncharacterized protein (TIGR03067 family)